MKEDLRKRDKVGCFVVTNIDIQNRLIQITFILAFIKIVQHYFL